MPRSTSTRDGWVRSARLAFEKKRWPGDHLSPESPIYPHKQKATFSIKKARRPAWSCREEGEEKESAGKRKGEVWGRERDRDGERADLMPVTLISAAGHAALLRDAMSARAFQFASSERKARTDRADTHTMSDERARGARGEEDQATGPVVRGLWDRDRSG